MGLPYSTIQTIIENITYYRDQLFMLWIVIDTLLILISNILISNSGGIPL